jgi:hypothetical protein
MVTIVLLPFILLLFAAIPATLIAYGLDPTWAQYPHGIQLILLTRRFQGPLIALVLILCLSLIAFIIAGKRRAWWLIGLIPIILLLTHRFAFNPQNAFAVNTRPNFVSADHAPFMTSDDYIVGLIDGPDPVAFPYASLYSHPVVVRSNQPDPMILLWSPFANCAVAERVDRSIRSEELDVVCMPANALLVYNSRIGQFINGFTGKTMKGQVPAGFIAPIPTIKTTWSQWLALHPTTLVLAPATQTESAPHHPILPYFPMPQTASAISPNTKIALIRTPFPVAALETDLSAQITNFSNPLILVIRDPSTGSLTALDRHVDQDLVPAFAPKTFKKFPQATMTDADSNSAWTPDGRAIDGPLKGKKLDPIEIETDLYYGITKFWLGDLRLISPLPPPEIQIQEPPPIHSTRHHRSK